MSTTGITHSNSSCATFTSDSDFKRSISFSRNGKRIAASRAAYSNWASDNSKFQLLKRSDLSTSSFRYRLATVTFFDIASAGELAGKQRVEQSTEIDAEIVLDELRVKLCVVRDLD